MKTRSDFVSNSSSCSFVVAVDFGKYDFDLFVEKTCLNCGGDEDVRLANEALLRYGMLSECLYLGSPAVGKKTEIWRRGETYGHDMLKPGEDDQYTPFVELSTNFLAASRAGETIRFLDEDTLEHTTPDELPAWTAATRNTMNDCIRHDWLLRDRSLRGKSAKARTKRIIEYVDQARGSKIRWPGPEVFRITLNTLKNTKDFLETGHNVSFSLPIDLSPGLIIDFMDEIEARIRAGETFLRVVINDHGEWQSDARLFMPDGYRWPFDGVPAENVTRLFAEL